MMKPNLVVYPIYSNCFFNSGVQEGQWGVKLWPAKLVVQVPFLLEEHKQGSITQSFIITLRKYCYINLHEFPFASSKISN